MLKEVEWKKLFWNSNMIKKILKIHKLMKKNNSANPPYASVSKLDYTSESQMNYINNNHHTLYANVPQEYEFVPNAFALHSNNNYNYGYPGANEDYYNKYRDIISYGTINSINNIAMAPSNNNGGIASKNVNYQLGYSNIGTSEPLKSRGMEEEHVIILNRNLSVTSKSSNSKYRCRYCGFEFVGGPQKIRVHLTGQKENGTRLSKCDKVPDAVKVLMETRKRMPKVFSPPELHAASLPPRCVEEQHCVVLERSTAVASRSSNTKYKCNYCSFQFVGGPQKIRVHLTGQSEGGTRVTKCTGCPETVYNTMLQRKKARKTATEKEESSSSSSSSSQLLQMPSQPTHMNPHITAEDRLKMNQHRLSDHNFYESNLETMKNYHQLLEHHATSNQDSSRNGMHPMNFNSLVPLNRQVHDTTIVLANRYSIHPGYYPMQSSNPSDNPSSQPSNDTFMMNRIMHQHPILYPTSVLMLLQQQQHQQQHHQQQQEFERLRALHEKDNTMQHPFHYPHPHQRYAPQIVSMPSSEPLSSGNHSYGSNQTNSQNFEDRSNPNYYNGMVSDSNHRPPFIDDHMNSNNYMGSGVEKGSSRYADETANYAAHVPIPYNHQQGISGESSHSEDQGLERFFGQYRNMGQISDASIQNRVENFLQGNARMEMSQARSMGISPYQQTQMNPGSGGMDGNESIRMGVQKTHSLEEPIPSSLAAAAPNDLQRNSENVLEDST